MGDFFVPLDLSGAWHIVSPKKWHVYWIYCSMNGAIASSSGTAEHGTREKALSQHRLGTGNREFLDSPE